MCQKGFVEYHSIHYPDMQVTDKIKLVYQAILGPHHLLDEKSHGYYKREAIAHMFQVETLCLLLAKERNLDEELCAIIGLLHDIAVPIYSSSFQHATRSSKLAKELLDPIFSEEEKNIILTAISNHSHKERKDDAYSELIKDADCWSHYLEKTVLKHEESERLKLLKIM